MDALNNWIPLFGGLAIGLLAIILIASQRGSKAKRREPQNPGETRIELTDSTPSGVSPAASSTHTTETSDLIKRNRELAREIAALTSKLQTSRNTIEIVQARLSRLEIKNSATDNVDVPPRAELDQLRDRSQPGDGLFDDADQLRQQAVTENLLLEAEMASLAERSELDGETVSLKLGGNAHNGIKTELETTRGQLDEMTRRHQELQNVNSRLRKETAELKRQLAARAEDIERLKAAQQWLNELQIKQDALTNSTKEFRKDFVRLRELLTPAPEPLWQLGSLAEIKVTEAAFEKETKSTESTQSFPLGTDNPQENHASPSKPDS